MYIEDDGDLDLVLGAGRPAEPPDLELVFEGVADRDVSFALMNRYLASNPHAARGFRAGQWFETTREVYWQCLESVPPLYMASGGFVVGECTMDDLYECFFEIDGRYFCTVIAWAGPQSDIGAQRRSRL